MVIVFKCDDNENVYLKLSDLNDVEERLRDAEWLYDHHVD